MKKAILVVAMVWGFVSLANGMVDSVMDSSKSHHARIAAIAGE